MYVQTTASRDVSPSRGLTKRPEIEREQKDHKLAPKGRAEDTSIAHVASGEIVVPKPVLDQNPYLRTAIMRDIAKFGVDPSQFMIDGNPTINPVTGIPEFGFFKKIFRKAKKLVKAAAPIIAPIALGPAGLGLTGAALTAASAGVGAGLGALDGGGLKGAVIGGVTGGLAGGGAEAITGAAGITGEAAKSAAKGALIGASAGSNFGVKGALLGAATGGVGGYVAGGGLNPTDITAPSGFESSIPKGTPDITIPSEGASSGLLGKAKTIASGLKTNVTADPLKYANLASGALQLAQGAPAISVSSPSSIGGEDQGITDNQQEDENQVSIGQDQPDVIPQPGSLDRTIKGAAYRGSRYRNF